MKPSDLTLKQVDELKTLWAGLFAADMAVRGGESPRVARDSAVGRMVDFRQRADRAGYDIPYGAGWEASSTWAARMLGLDVTP